MPRAPRPTPLLCPARCAGEAQEPWASHAAPPRGQAPSSSARISQFLQGAGLLRHASPCPTSPPMLPCSAPPARAHPPRHPSPPAATPALHAAHPLARRHHANPALRVPCSVFNLTDGSEYVHGVVKVSRSTDTTPQHSGAAAAGQRHESTHSTDRTLVHMHTSNVRHATLLCALAQSLPFPYSNHVSDSPFLDSPFSLIYGHALPEGRLPTTHPGPSMHLAVPVPHPDPLSCTPDQAAHVLLELLLAALHALQSTAQCWAAGGQQCSSAHAA